MPEPLRAAAYVRVSTTEQAAEGLSLGEQERRVTAHIEREGWQLAGLYREAGVSGRREDRPELGRLLDGLDSIDVLVIFKLDRLGRSNRHLLELYGRLEEAGVQLVSLSENIDTTTPSGKLLRSMLSSMAEFEADTISERVRAVTTARARQGKPNGGLRPYGYRHKDGSLAIVRDEAAIVRRIYREFVAGRSQLAIANDLHREGVHTARGGQWHQPAVSNILRNPVYVGRIRHKGEVYDGLHKAIIKPALWEQAANLRSTRARTSGTSSRPPRGQHLFVRGMLRCGLCGEHMMPRTNANRKVAPYEVYLCHGRNKRGADFCSMPPLRRAEVDRAVFDYFAAVGLDLEATRTAIAEASEQRLVEVRALRERAEREATEAAERLARVKRDYQSGKIDAEDWSEQRAELTQENAAARAEAGRLRDRERQITEAAAGWDAEATTLRYLDEIRASIAGEVAGREDAEAVRAVLLRLFERFEVYRGTVADLEPEDGPGPADDDPTVEALAAGEFVILAKPRPETVAGIDENFYPVLRREPLGRAGNKSHNGLPM